PGDALELLAQMEHERWMRQKQAAGWKYGSKTDKSKKLHSTIREWKELPEAEKEKDRAMVRGIPAILARAGYAIEKV
ncbi:MAG: RyR domain-containing protein, partial [Anaerolineaceae bacterium]|nr:RyR domain-containing protein [Anaerolineaceae bacterium]